MSRPASIKTEWPADKVERRPVADLLPYARNARDHDDEQVAQIMASIREFGWTNAVLVDENGVLIAGHGRVLAAKRLGLAEVPTTVARGWTEAQIKAYRLADNKLALNATWNNAVLADELGKLSDMGFDLDLTGFDGDEVDKLLAPPEDDGDVVIKKIETDPVFDRFWINVEGPLAKQADALQALRKLMEAMPEVEVTLGTVARNV